MADRLTQLQDAINQQADNFTNSLGILQQFATPSPFTGLGDKAKNSKGNCSNIPGQQPSAANNPPALNQSQQNEDHTTLFAQLISRTAKDIEYLIDSLPGEESSADLQASSLQKLEAENQEASDKLQKVVEEGENRLKKIQSALHDLAHTQLEIQKLEEALAS